MQLLPNGKAQWIDANGAPLANGTVGFYAPGTLTPQATYQDQAGSIANTNPITLDSRGQAIVWGTGTYRQIVKDSSGVTIWDQIVDTPAGGASLANNVGAGGAALIGFNGGTLADFLKGNSVYVATNIAALRAIDSTIFTNAYVLGYSTMGDGGAGEFYYDPADTTSLDNGGSIIVAANGARWKLTATAFISVKQFGAKGDGTTDDTVALQAAATALAGKTIFFPDGTYIVSAAVNLPTNTTLTFAPNATVQSSSNTTSIFAASSATNIKSTGGTFKYTTASNTGLIGGFALTSCTYCTIKDGQFVGMQFSGVFLNNSNSCTVENNTITGTLGTHQDANDICVYNNSSSNRVIGNKCYGTGSHGVLHQGTTDTIPYQNIIDGNFITQKNAYGITVYLVTPNNTETTVSNNYVKDIQGSANSGTTGSGIYIQSSGGTNVKGNHVDNCCVLTTSSVNLPAGISIAFDVTAGPGLNPVTVEGNQVSTGKYSAIAAANCRVNITNNPYIQTTDTAAGSGIQVQDCSHSIVAHNAVRVPAASGRPGISFGAVTASQSDNVVSNNNVSGGDGIMLQVYGTNSFTWSGVVNGNSTSPSGSSAQGLVMSLVFNASVNSNMIVGSAVGLGLTSCNRVRGAGNTIITNSTNRILTAGTCSDCFFDASNNFFLGAPSLIQNQVAGVTIEQRNTSAPNAGSWQVGDRMKQAAPATGQPKAWVCTVAGAPGTWVSEGNL